MVKKVKICHKCNRPILAKAFRHEGNIYHATCIHQLKMEKSRKNRGR